MITNNQPWNNLMMETENFIYKICDNRIIFSNNFNKPIISYKITKPLETKNVIYCKKHNKTLCVPQNVTHMIFNHRYNKRIIIPPNIKCLTLGDCSRSEFEFNNGLSELTFGRYFDNLVILPREIKKLTLGDYFNNVLKLNRKICELKFGCNYNREILLNSNMRKISFGTCYNFLLLLNANMRVLIFGDDFNKPIKLNKRLEMLYLGKCFFHNIILSKRLLRATIHSIKNMHYSVLPKNLKHLALGIDIFGTYCFNKKLCLLTVIDKRGFVMSIEKNYCSNNDVFDPTMCIFDYNIRDNSKIEYIIDDLPNCVNRIISNRHIMLNNEPSSLCKSKIIIIPQHKSVKV